MSDVNVTVIGHVGQDPTLFVSDAGTKWTALRVASTRRRQTPDGWVDGPTIWFTVRAYGSRAENVVDSIKKGTPVVVVGRLAVEQYDVRKTAENSTDATPPERRTSNVIENARIAVDLSRGIAKWQRVVHVEALPTNKAYSNAELPSLTGPERSPFEPDNDESADENADASAFDRQLVAV